MGFLYALPSVLPTGKSEFLTLPLCLGVQQFTHLYPISFSSLLLFLPSLSLTCSLFLPRGFPALWTPTVNHSQISLMADIQRWVPAHCVVLCEPRLCRAAIPTSVILPSQPQGTTLSDVLTVTGVDGDLITGPCCPQAETSSWRNTDGSALLGAAESREH